MKWILFSGAFTVASLLMCVDGAQHGEAIRSAVWGYSFGAWSVCFFDDFLYQIRKWRNDNAD
jgi:hypothetical protein